MNSVNKFCDNLQLLNQHTGLTKVELQQIGYYIETKLPAEVQAGRCYLKKNVTKLPRTIEYDKVTKQVFIHLKTHGKVPLVGEGGFKKVTKSIVYNPDRPEIIANCATEMSDVNEALLLAKFSDIKGLASAKAVTTHKTADGSLRLNIFMKLYKPGSLQDLLDNHTSLSLKEKIKIAYDVVCGLTGLHERQLVHRDIKPGNVLVDFIDRSAEHKPRKVQAVVSDFGLLYDKTKHKGKLDFAHGTDFFAPSIGLVSKSVKRKDFKVVDIYPLGITLYNLFHNGKDPQWLAGNTQEKAEKKIKKGTKPKDVKKYLDDKVSNEVDGRIKDLKQLPSKTSSEKFELIILKMIAPSTQKKVGHSLKEVGDQLKKLYKKL